MTRWRKLFLKRSDFMKDTIQKIKEEIQSHIDDKYITGGARYGFEESLRIIEKHTKGSEYYAEKTGKTY